MKAEFFQKFSGVLRADQAPVVRDPRLLMADDDHVKIYYAPFEYINPLARIVLVGITPGPTQMVSANHAARQALLSGLDEVGAMIRAKAVAAFSGEPLRSNLVNQLNHWGFNNWLGLEDSAEFFSGAAHLVQTTSLLRYPVFVNGDDYRGNPDMLKHPLLRQYLFDHFVAEVEEIKDAVFVGLGPLVQKVLNHLVKEGVLSKDRVIGGMLHPSGNCTYRINYLIGERKKPVPHATNPLPYDQGRRLFQEQYLR